MNDETEVLRLDDRRWDALTSADTEALDELFHDDLSYTHSNGAVDTKESYLDAVGSGAFRYTAVDRSDVLVRVFGQTAVVTGHAGITSELKGATVLVSARYSAVWSRIGGAWRFVCWHACPVARS